MCPYPLDRRWIAGNVATLIQPSTVPTPFVSPITAGKVSEYDFRFAKAGQNVPDSNGSGHTLVPGSGSAAPGVSPEGATFNGSQFYSDDSSGWLGVPNGFTFMTLAMASVLPQASALFWTGASGGERTALWLGNGSVIGDAGSTLMGVAGTTGSGTFGYNWTANEFTVMTMINTTSGSTLYTNDAVLAPNIVPFYTNNPILAPNDVATTSVPATGSPFTGTIAYLVVYDAVLTTANINTIYAAMKTSMSASGINLP